VRLERNLKPKLRLDHIIKERYPTFVDALRDLDDALSMLFLFANLPSTSEVPPKVVARCQRLTTEFEHYLIRTHSLRKSFLSIKGIYYEATIQGQDILWLVPYKFVQRAGGDIDYRIMATFVEFYTTLLGFVNFRLYTSIGLVYPPRFDVKSEEQGAELGAYHLEGRNENEQQQIESAVDIESNEKAQAEADRLLALPAEEDSSQGEDGSTREGEAGVDEGEDQPQTALDQFAPIDDKADDLLQPSLTADATAAGQLFEPFTVYLSRETPQHALEFILRSFGCKRLGWDTSLGDPGSYCSLDDKRITHQIVDRPDLPLPSPPPTDGEVEVDGNQDDVIVRQSNERVPGRIYVQPQWVWDSINAGQLQRPDLYAPGATLPPHLSPWVKPKRGEYDPTVPLAEQETEVERELDEDEAVESDVEEQEGNNASSSDEAEVDIEAEDDESGDMNVELADSSDEESADQAEVNGDADGDEWGGFSGDEGDELETNNSARQAQAELEAEALGQQASTTLAKSNGTKQTAQTKRARADREAQEDLERRKMMMPRRKRKVYEKMVHSNARKDEEAEKLRAKRRKIEKKAGGHS
jgi:pescadillo protein